MLRQGLRNMSNCELKLEKMTTTTATTAISGLKSNDNNDCLLGVETSKPARRRMQSKMRADASCTSANDNEVVHWKMTPLSLVDERVNVIGHARCCKNLYWVFSYAKFGILRSTASKQHPVLSSPRRHVTQKILSRCSSRYCCILRQHTSSCDAEIFSMLSLPTRSKSKTYSSRDT